MRFKCKQGVRPSFYQVLFGVKPLSTDSNIRSALMQDLVNTSAQRSSVHKRSEVTSDGSNEGPSSTVLPSHGNRLAGQ